MHATSQSEAVEPEVVTPKNLSFGQILQAVQSGENLAFHLDETQLGLIGNEVVEGYEKDLASRSGWETRMDKAMELAMQVVQSKTHPWPGASNVKMPLMTIASQQFASRAFPQLVKEPEPVKGKVNGQPTAEKLAKAQRIGQHMSYQLIEQIEGWVEGMDVLLHVLPIMGCDIKKTYKDAEGIRSERVSVKDVVWDYYGPNVEKCRRKTHVIPMHRQEILEKQSFGEFLNVELSDPSSESQPKDEIKDKVGGTEAPSDPSVTPHLLLEQHWWKDLDGDGYEEPYVLTVLKDSKKVLKISPRFYVDGIFLSHGEGVFTKRAALEEFEAPSWEAIEAEGWRVAKISPDEYFTQWVFFPDPTGGNLGLGWGHTLFPMNEAINTLVNQLVDAGTLANLQGGFISSSLAKDWKSGSKKLAMNEWHKVNAPFEDLSKGLVPFPFKGPSAVLFQLLGLLVEWAQRLTSVTDSMQGDSPPTNQPATTTLAMLEQGQKVFQGIYKRLYRALSQELKKIKRLNRLHLTAEEYFQVLDITPEDLATERGLPPGYGMVLPTDYQTDDTDVSPSADPSITSEQQAMARADALVRGRIEGQLPYNPQRLAQIHANALQVPKADQQGLILPPPDPSQTPPDPSIEAEKLRQEGNLQGKMAELEMKREEMAHKHAMTEDEQAHQREMDAANFEHQREIDHLDVQRKREEAHLKAAVTATQNRIKRAHDQE
jgi:chaperonin GroES